METSDTPGDLNPELSQFICKLQGKALLNAAEQEFYDARPKSWMHRMILCVIIANSG